MGLSHIVLPPMLFYMPQFLSPLAVRRQAVVLRYGLNVHHSPVPRRGAAAYSLSWRTSRDASYALHRLTDHNLTLHAGKEDLCVVLL